MTRSFHTSAEKKQSKKVLSYQQIRYKTPNCQILSTYSTIQLLLRTTSSSKNYLACYSPFQLSTSMSKGIDQISDHQFSSKFQQAPKSLEEEAAGIQALIQGSNDKQVEEYSSSCRTPTSLDHRILVIQSCPATPRKKQGRVFLHKRKLEFPDFFESSRDEEVESFFQSCSQSPANNRVKKKRCSSI